MANKKVTLKRVIDNLGNTDTLQPTTAWDQIEEKPTTFAPTAHTHTVDDIDSESTAQGLAIVSDGAGGAVWELIEGGGGASVTVSTTEPLDPEEGDLWFDATDLTLYLYYDDGQSQQWISVSGESVTTIFVDDNPPNNPSAGALWFDSSTLKLFIYYNDGTSAQWVNLSGGGGASVTVDNAEPANASEGDLWFDTTTKTLKIYYDKGTGIAWNNALNNVYTKGEIDALLADKVNLSDLETTLTLYGTDTTEVVGADTYFQMVTSLDDARYNDTAVTITTPTITSTDENNPNIVGRLIADTEIIDELLQGKIINTVGQVRKASGNKNENPRLRFTVYNSDDLTTLIAQSGYTSLIESEDFFNVSESEVVLQTTQFSATDRLVIIWEGYTTQGSPTVDIKFGGNDSVRTVIPKTFDATISAGNVIYDNTTSGLAATNIKTAIDELALDLGSLVTVSDTAPQSAEKNDLWFNSTNLTLYIYYDDGDSLQWVNAAGGLVNETINNADGGSSSTVFSVSDITLEGGGA